MLHYLQAMKMTFLKLFLIRMLKNPNLKEIFRSLAKKEKKMNSVEFMEFVVFLSLT